MRASYSVRIDGLTHTLRARSTRSGSSIPSLVAPGAWFVERLAVYGEPDVLGHIGRMVADALDVFGDEKQMRASRDAALVFHHVGKQLAEQRRIEGIELGVALPDEIGRAHV